MCREKKEFLLGLLLAVVIVTFIGWGKEVGSQEKYPTRPIEIISPYGPGGANDATARITADYLKKRWHVPVNVVNKPGGNTIPANLELYRAAPDGYTVICDQEAVSVILEVTEKNLPFKAYDRTWIGIPHLAGMLFVVPSASPYKSLNDVIADLKKDPDNFTWGSFGGSGGADTCFRLLFRAIGVDVRRTKPVVCEGAAKCIALAAGGHIKMACVSVSASVPLINAGTIRALAIATKQRSSEVPDIPTVAELGYPAVNYLGWIGFSGPPKMPSFIVDMWNKELKEMTKDPEVISRFKGIKSFLVYINSLEMKEIATNTLKELNELYAPAR